MNSDHIMLLLFYCFSGDTDAFRQYYFWYFSIASVMTKMNSDNIILLLFYCFSDDTDEFRHTRQVFEELEIEQYTIEDCRIVQYCCSLVSSRAAYLASAGTSSSSLWESRSFSDWRKKCLSHKPIICLTNLCL